MGTFTQAAWAAVDMKAEPRPHIMAWSICGSPTAVRRAVGLAWTEKKDATAGWLQARSEGIRVQKIEMSFTPQD